MALRFRNSVNIWVLLLLAGTVTGLGQSGAGDRAPITSGSGRSGQSRPVDNTEGAVDENPRQRGKVLDKRNPLATEYQTVSDVGEIMLSDTDAEGVNNRERFASGDLFEGAEEAISAQLSYKYSDLSQKGIWQGNISYRRLFGKNRNWALSLKGERNGVNHIFEDVSMRWRLSHSAGEPLFFLDRLWFSQTVISTVRNQIHFTLEHRFNDRHRAYLKTHFEDRKDGVLNHRLNLRFGEGEIDSFGSDFGSVRNADAERTVWSMDEHRNRIRLLIGGEYEGENTGFDYSFYFSRWERERSIINPIFRAEGVDYDYSLEDPAFPTHRVRGAMDLNDSSQYFFSETILRGSLTSDRDFAIQLNYEKRLKINALAGSFKTGVVYRTKERTNEDERLIEDGFVGTFSMDKVSGDDLGKIVRGTYQFGPGINPDAFRTFVAEEGGRFIVNEGRSRIESDPNNYRVAEDVAGLYFLQTIRGDRWEVKGGLRFELTTADNDGNEVLTDAEGEYLATEAVSRSNKYYHWLPAIEFDYKFGEGAKLRAAWFHTLARPDYFDLVPFRRISTNFQFISEGNPGLAPTVYRNAIIGADLTNALVGELTLAVYYKKLEAFFYESETIISGGRFDGWDLSRKENGGDASVWGFEIGWKRKAKFLQELLGDLTVTAFYTFSESRAEVPTRPDERLILPERSRHFASVTVTYATGPLEMVFSLNYQSRFLEDIGSDHQKDEFIDEAVRMNYALNLRLSPQVRTFVKFSNFIDQPERRFEGDGARITQNQYNSWKIETGIGFRL